MNFGPKLARVLDDDHRMGVADGSAKRSARLPGTTVGSAVRAAISTVIVLGVFAGAAGIGASAASAAAGAASPAIESESVSQITATDARLEATIEPAAGRNAYYQFQLAKNPSEFASEFTCPTEDHSSLCLGITPQENALPIGSVCGECEIEPAVGPLDLAKAGITLQPGTTYHYRVIAATAVPTEDTTEWEEPTIFGAAHSFTTSPPNLSMTFTEDRANVGVQLSDAPMFEAPETAPFAALIDPGTGSISAGILEVPDFFTHITEPLNADVLVHFEIGIIEGSFDQATGALSLEGEANATLTSNEKQCTVTTTPNPLVLSTAGNSGGANPRSGAAFVKGLTGAGAIAGQWTDMSATPKIPGDGVFVCATVDERIEGPGGIWLVQEGDIVPPSAPQLTSTDPASPGASGTPRIRGSAEAGSTVRLYAGSGCAGLPVATGSAAELASPGIAVAVDFPATAFAAASDTGGTGTTATFSATATDAAANTSPCSASIAYTRTGAVCTCLPRPPAVRRCVVPGLRGKTLAQAKAALKKRGCRLGDVRRPKSLPAGHPPLVVVGSSPRAGKRPRNRTVDLRLGPRLRKRSS
jgi:hypothetical protein